MKRFIIVSVVAPTLGPATFAANAGFSLSLSNVLAGTPLYFDASTNLANWVNLQTSYPGGSNFLFLDAEATNYSRRFYRVRLEP